MQCYLATPFKQENENRMKLVLENWITSYENSCATKHLLTYWSLVNRCWFNLNTLKPQNFKYFNFGWPMSIFQWPPSTLLHKLEYWWMFANGRKNSKPICWLIPADSSFWFGTNQNSWFILVNKVNHFKNPNFPKTSVWRVEWQHCKCSKVLPPMCFKVFTKSFLRFPKIIVCSMWTTITNHFS